MKKHKSNNKEYTTEEERIKKGILKVVEINPPTEEQAIAMVKRVEKRLNEMAEYKLRGVTL